MDIGKIYEFNGEDVEHMHGHHYRALGPKKTVHTGPGRTTADLWPIEDACPADDAECTSQGELRYVDDDFVAAHLTEVA